MATLPTTDSSQRIVSLDLIRGMAVMGILSVNITDFAMNQAAYLNPWALGRPSSADLTLWAANMLLVMDRASAAGASGPWTHVRRMLVLFALGMAHAILLWRGDILSLYAMAGLIALLFARLELPKLLVWAGLLIVMHTILFAAITATLVHQDQVAHSAAATADIVRNWNANASSVFPTAAGIADDQAIFDGSWAGFASHQLSRIGGILSNGMALMPDTLGLMLLGMAAYRSGFLTGEWSDARYRRIAVWGIGIGLVGHSALVAANLLTDFYVPVVLGGFLSAMVPFRLAQAFGYAALFILWSRRRSPAAARVAAVGRAAFTNYIGTSLVCVPIFYGWGLGLYNDVSRVEAWLVVPVVWGLMLLWSKPWLDRFRFGPFEWLWRSLAYARPQPLRRRR